MSLLLTDQQREIVEFPDKGILFVSGDAGTGKTTASVERFKKLSSNTLDPDKILVLAPQRSLANPYQSALDSPEYKFPAPHSILTIGGLAQRSISLFWPLVARESGFKNYKKPPVFLTLELTQYYLSTLIDPLLEKGYFSSISIDRLRLYSQVIDNLNKSAVVGFQPDTISSRLSSAWSGKNDQTSVFDQAQECALLFRNYCLEYNLLDFSLQVQMFSKNLWKSFIYRQYLKNRYQHLIYENAEEDFPVAHDIVEDWLPDLQSAVILTDNNGGFRTFLGADPVSAKRFIHLAGKFVTLETKFEIPYGISNLSAALGEAINDRSIKSAIDPAISEAFEIQTYRFFPETLENFAAQVKILITDQNVSPNEIVLLTPFLSDSLLFSASERFKALDIPIIAFRPSRGLKDEAAVKAVLTFAKLAFPEMGLIPEKEDVRNALMTAITGCDLIRADLLAQMVYSSSNNLPSIRAYDSEKNVLRTRITNTVGERFEMLRKWLADHASSAENELDVFLSRLFGELLSQKGYNFHLNVTDAAIISQLIASARRFRRTVLENETFSTIDLGKKYIQLVENGILSSQYLIERQELQEKKGVLISPAHSFLTRNSIVQYQFWLDIGSSSWWTRLNQPLTQPYVLNRNWNEKSRWTDAEEYSTNQMNLSHLVEGLLNRCSKKVILAAIDINQQGNEERSALMVAVQTLLKKKCTATG